MEAVSHSGVLCAVAHRDVERHNGTTSIRSVRISRLSLRLARRQAVFQCFGALRRPSHGSVSDIRVIERTDPKTANAVVAAVKRWRLKPWEVTEDMPAVIGESVQFLFDQERLEKRLRMVISWERRGGS